MVKFTYTIEHDFPVIQGAYLKGSKEGVRETVVTDIPPSWILADTFNASVVVWTLPIIRIR